MRVRRLGPGDDAAFAAMLDVFADVFEDAAYTAARPGAAYRARLLADAGFVALVAEADGATVGALAGYEMRKFEQERSEFYCYDLAVRETHRRQGVATALLEAFRQVAAAAGGWVVMVQADPGDDPAVALYTKLGAREDVLHFDIPVGGADPSGDAPRR